MKIVQVELRSPKNSKLTTWVDSRPDLKVGCDITIKDMPGIVWRVTEIYTGAEHEASEFDWHRKWDNNI